MKEFSIGDVVQLKSGGPDMTITEIQKGKALCLWQAWSGETGWHEFPLPCLVIAPPKAKDEPKSPRLDAGILSNA